MYNINYAALGGDLREAYMVAFCPKNTLNGVYIVLIVSDSIKGTNPQYLIFGTMVQIQNVTTLAFLFLIVGTFNLQAQQTHIVDLSGTGDFTSIHAAVDAASAGDTIRVQPDQYAFTADLGAIEVGKKLIIIGSGYMKVEEGGTELVDITGNGFFDLTSSADGTVIRGFRIQGATDFLDTESGTSGITVEENLFIEGDNVITLFGSADTVRSNIFLGDGSSSNSGLGSIGAYGANTVINNNLFTRARGAAHNRGILEVQDNGSGVKVYNNLFDQSYYHTSYSGGLIYAEGAPEIYSNGLIGMGSSSKGIHVTGSAFVTNNSFYQGIASSGLNAVEDAPSFVSFDVDNEELDLEKIDEGEYDLNLADGSAWIDAGRTGTPYLDTDGSRSDIGLYGGPFPFQDGKGAPSVPVVIDFQVSPTTVSPSGTITIQATGRIGGN